ncbi:MAG: basic membrane protein A [Candidatus Promineifilaceae bacterium]|jgi:basic membrane protein A
MLKISFKSSLLLSAKMATLVLLSACSTQLANPNEVSINAGSDLQSTAGIDSEPIVVEKLDRAGLICTDKELLCVGVVTGAGGINDQSLNQFAWEGAQRAEFDLNAQVEHIEITDARDSAMSIKHFAEQDYDIIVTVGFSLRNVTLQMAQEYPSIDFIGVDQSNNSDEVTNLAGLVFPNTAIGFLSGALAAMVSKTKVVGVVLGPHASLSSGTFNQGFRSGVSAINQDIEVMSIYYPGKITESYNDPEWGAQTAQFMLAGGADVIAAAAGHTGDGALIEIASNSNAFCIGVDTDQWIALPEAQSCLVSSATKQIADGVFQLIAFSLLEKMPQGNYTGRVELAPFHQYEEFFPSDVKQVLIDLNTGLVDGSISTGGSYIYQDPPTVLIKR